MADLIEAGICRVPVSSATCALAHVGVVLVVSKLGRYKCGVVLFEPMVGPTWRPSAESNDARISAKDNISYYNVFEFGVNS